MKVALGKHLLNFTSHPGALYEGEIVRMFWKRSPRHITDDSAADAVSAYKEVPLEPVRVERGSRRPAAILRLAEALEQRGIEVVELFDEVESSRGQAVLSLHLLEDGDDFFAEVETEPWNEASIDRILGGAAALRGSAYSNARLEVFSAYPVPEEVAFLTGRSMAALLQLDLRQQIDDDEPEMVAETFRRVAGLHWGIDLDYGTEGLPLAEALLLSALGEADGGARAPVLEVLETGLGYYVGEVVRRNSKDSGHWSANDSGLGRVLEIGAISVDAVGVARAFLQSDGDSSIAHSVGELLEKLGGPSHLQS